MGSEKRILQVVSKSVEVRLIGIEENQELIGQGDRREYEDSGTQNL